MRKSFVCLVLVTLFAVLYLPASMQGQGNSNPPPQARAEVSLPDHFDSTNRPLRDMFPDKEHPTPRGGRDFEPGRPQPVGNANPATVDQLAEKNSGRSAATADPKAATIGTAVDPNRRVAPPDTTGDVGPNHYVQWVNLRYAVYTLTRDASNVIIGFNLAPGFPKQGNVVWQGFGGPCEKYNDGDPIVQYDQLADRWIITQFAVSAQPYTQCVAVSQTPDPTGAYYRYSYSYGRDFNDYPKMGVWPNGYYITYNMFRNGRNFVGSKVCAFERDRMLIGATARQICAQTSNSYGSLLPADLEGTAIPAAGSPNPLLSITSSSLLSWRFSVNWSAGTGTLTGPTTVPGVAAFTRACGGGTCIPQPGTTQKLDSLGDRLMYRLSYRKIGTQESLLVNHSVTSGSTTGIRWYVLSNPFGTPSVSNQGTFAPDNLLYRWMGSAAMDKTGGIAIGYNVSSSAVKPSIQYAYRGPSDGPGVMGNETNILAGSGSQLTTLSRWGDYSTLSVDPVDGCTMVFTTEYLPANGTFNWSTYIYSFKLSTCQ